MKSPSALRIWCLKIHEGRHKKNYQFNLEVWHSSRVNKKKVFKRLQNQPLNWRSCNAAKKKADSNFPLSNLLFFAKHGQQQIRQTSYSNTIHGSGIFTYTLIPWNFKPFADPVNTLDSSHGSVMGWDLKPPGASLVEGPVAWIQWQLADADWWHHQWDFIKNTSSVPTCVFWCNKNGVKK